jgi:uncharacterized protein YfaS (alpha-2-macroglobulin family)
VILKFVALTWTKVEKSDNGHTYADFEVRERELSSAEVVTDAQGHAYHEYRASETGNVHIKTIVASKNKQYVSLGGNLWITDSRSQWIEDGYGGADYTSIKLVTDKKSYRPGETAHRPTFSPFFQPKMPTF